MPTQLASRRVAVVGLGKSGLSVVRFCIERGAKVVACDDREESALASSLSSISPLLSTGRLDLALGGLRPDVLCAADLIVCSPGVPPTRPALVAARQAGVPITVPASVRPELTPASRAIPKSMTIGRRRPSAPVSIMMLAGSRQRAQNAVAGAGKRRRVGTAEE